METAHKYEWDDAKAASNAEKHGVSFETVSGFQWDAALIAEDKRGPFAEKRFVAVGPVLNRLHVLVYTMRGQNVRVISLRKANRREVRYYEES